MKQMVPNENGLKKYFKIKLGDWFLVSWYRPFCSTILWTYKLKYYVIVEKMALATFGNLGFPDSNMRLVAAKQRWMLWLQIL